MKHNTVHRLHVGDPQLHCEVSVACTLGAAPPLQSVAGTVSGAAVAVVQKPLCVTRAGHMNVYQLAKALRGTELVMVSKDTDQVGLAQVHGGVRVHTPKLVALAGAVVYGKGPY
jgi:hypothetical protein